MKKFIFYGIVAGLVAGIAYVLYRRSGGSASIVPFVPVVPGSSNSLNCNKQLSRGSRGSEVRELQKWINSDLPTPYVPLVVDGIFGPLTEEGLRVVFESIYAQGNVKSIRLLDLPNYTGCNG